MVSKQKDLFRDLVNNHYFQGIQQHPLMTTIQKISEKKEQQFEPFSIDYKNIELSFTGDRVSSDGGLLLLCEVNRQLGLTNSISKCISDKKDGPYVDYCVKELFAKRVFQIA